MSFLSNKPEKNTIRCLTIRTEADTELRLTQVSMNLPKYQPTDLYQIAYYERVHESVSNDPAEDLFIEIGDSDWVLADHPDTYSEAFNLLRIRLMSDDPSLAAGSNTMPVHLMKIINPVDWFSTDARNILDADVGHYVNLIKQLLEFSNENTSSLSERNIANFCSLMVEYSEMLCFGVDRKSEVKLREACMSLTAAQVKEVAAKQVVRLSRRLAIKTAADNGFIVSI